MSKLRHLAVILLVLLLVLTAMGGSGEQYRYFISHANSSVCLSFRYRLKLADTCDVNDKLQRIYTTKTSPNTGLFHTGNKKKLLCYDPSRGKFKLMKRTSLRRLFGLGNTCRHHRHHHGDDKKGRHDCPFTDQEKAALSRTSNEVHATELQCDLTEMTYSYTYIYGSKNDNHGACKSCLAVKNGRAQRHYGRRHDGRRGQPKKIHENYKQFLVLDPATMKKISKRHRKNGGH